jgi:serine/threonine protein kinase
MVSSHRTSPIRDINPIKNESIGKEVLRIQITNNKILNNLSNNSTPKHKREINPIRETLNPQREVFIGTSELPGYSLGKQIGRGGYAIVKCGIRNDDGIKVAIKIYEKYMITSNQRKNCIDREIRILKQLKHPNIVKLYETFDTLTQLLLVMELVNGESLHSYVHSKSEKRLSETEALTLFIQIANAIAYCHERDVIHRDIKMANVLLDENHKVKIIDFGFSICTSSRNLSVPCGTPVYMAPEVLTKKNYNGKLTDIWSLGVLLFNMLCGCFPFAGNNERELLETVPKGEFTFPVTVSEETQSLVRKMLCVDPERRASASKVYKEASSILEKRKCNQIARSLLSYRGCIVRRI